MEDLPNRLLRDVKFLECQQNGDTGPRIVSAREDQAVAKLSWEIQCFGKVLS